VFSFFKKGVLSLYPYTGGLPPTRNSTLERTDGERPTSLNSIFQHPVRALRAKPATVSVDLSDVSYIDTSGSATLVEAVRLARRQGTRLLVVGMKDQPRYLFEITHLDRFFDTPAPEAST